MKLAASFWLAPRLIARGIETHVIHSASVAVSRERKPAKTDRLDAAMLMRVFLGWLRGERGHCGMVAIPAIEDEDARRSAQVRLEAPDPETGKRTRHAVDDARTLVHKVLALAARAVAIHQGKLAKANELNIWIRVFRSHLCK
jgi:hypothetical protein